MVRIRRATLVTSVAIVVVAALAAVLAWRWQIAGTRSVALEPGWEAIVVTIAGTFPDPFGVAAAADGTVFVADAGEAPRILRIAADGLVHTVAGEPADSLTVTAPPPGSTRRRRSRSAATARSTSPIPATTRSAACPPTATSPRSPVMATQAMPMAPDEWRVSMARSASPWTIAAA